MIRPYASTSRTRLGSRVAANNAPQAAPYSTTSSPYGSPPARAPQAGPRPPDVRQAAQAPAQGIVGRVDTGRPVMPPSLPRSAFAPNMGRQPETPPSTQVQPQQGWSASNDKEDPIWRNTWRSHGEGVWGANADANSGGYPMPPGMRPANIDQTRLQPPPDYGLTATRRNPQMIWPAEVEPQDDAVPTGQDAPITLRGGQGPAGSPPPPEDESGIGVNVSGLTGTSAVGSTPEGEEYRNEQRDADRSEEYASMSDEELAARAEQARLRYYATAGSRVNTMKSGPEYEEWMRLEQEQKRRETAASIPNAPPDENYTRQAAEGTGLTPEQIQADYEDGYRWAQSPETGEWTRYSMADMAGAIAYLEARGYRPGDNPYVDAVLKAIKEGRAPNPDDVARMMLEYDSDGEVGALLDPFRGQTITELRASNAYKDSPHSSGSDDEGDWWSDEFSALYESLMDELNKEWEPFDDGALKQASALDRSQQMRAALEMASAQGASTGQVQSALSDIGLRSESQLNSQVAEGNMASQIAKAQRNAGMIAQAISILNAQMANATSREEAEANRELQMRLTQMGIAQQNRMDRIQAERDRQRTFWDSLGGAFGGLLGLGGQLGGAYLGRPTYR